LTTAQLHFYNSIYMERDIRLDALRGLVLVWMTINHLSGPLHAYSFETLGFVSSAEGFVFISGLVAGMVYGRIGLTQGTSPLRKKAFRRVLDIYLFHMAAFLFVMILEITISNKAYYSFYVYMNPLPTESPILALSLGAAFLLQPPFLDILPMYCFFLLITPFCINRFKNKYGCWWVLAGSFLIWAPATYSSWDTLQRYGEHFLPLNFGFFDPFAWQFLFVGGLFFGFRRYTAQSIPIKKSLITISLLIWIGILLFRYKILPSNIGLWGVDIPSLTFRETFGPLRVINLAALAYLISCFGTRFPNLLKWPWFSYIGSHSLQVFTFHLVLLYSILPLYDSLIIPAGWAWIIAADMVILSTLTIPAWLHVQYRKIKNRKGSSVGKVKASS
jgi:hypothetical protein